MNLLQSPLGHPPSHVQCDQPFPVEFGLGVWPYTGSRPPQTQVTCRCFALAKPIGLIHPAMFNADHKTLIRCSRCCPSTTTSKMPHSCLLGSGDGLQPQQHLLPLARPPQFLHLCQQGVQPMPTLPTIRSASHQGQPPWPLCPLGQAATPTRSVICDQMTSR